MPTNRPFVLSIAGLDPSGGAGILADVKTFEQHCVTGFAIMTANTIQTENNFYAIEWTSLNFVLHSIQVLLENYDIKAVKIGIVPSLDYLKEIVFTVKRLSPKTKIVWDTVLKSTTEFDFMEIENQSVLYEILGKLDLITPNYNEMERLFSCFDSSLLWRKPEVEASILLKGGHNTNETGVDYLYTKDAVFRLAPKDNNCYTKHGSGCVLSATIVANIALGEDLKTACIHAKNYIEKYLNSNPSLIGYHYV
jgi:hydroxymethylpyrimidine/phosphomethylpyrimidine kinase